MNIENITIILVIITGIYAYLTYRISKSTEASTIAAVRPYITIAPYIRAHTPFIYLRIKNTGKSSANNLCLTINKDFYQFGEANNPERNIKNLPSFQNAIDSFAPDMELSLALGQGWVILDESNQNITPSQFTITSVYSYGLTKIKEEHRIDLRSYKGTEGERNVVAEELEKIRKEIEKIAKKGAN